MSPRLRLPLAACALLGCAVQVDPELALPYRCDPGGAVDQTQCAGGWRCAADGFCRDPAVGVPTPCQTSADCLGGWHCGSVDLCYDRARAGAIPCRPALEADGGSDCAPGWRCPSGGICQQRGAFAPYPCGSTADCEGGGHCGVSGRCYLKELAEGVACREELDGDPAARDCAPAWVCSPTGRCVDARAHALRPGGPSSALQARALAPVDLHRVDHLAAECFRPTEDTCAASTALTLARGSRLELHRVPAAGAVGPPVLLSLPGDVLALATTTAPGAAQQAYSLVVAGGGVLHVSWPPSGAPVATPIAVPFVPDRLLAPSAVPWFLGLRGPDLFLVDRASAAVRGPVRLPDVPPGGAPSYGGVTAFAMAQDFWMMASSAEGAFAARGRAGAFLLTDGGTQPVPDWTPVRVPGIQHRLCPEVDGGTGVLSAVSPTSSGSSGSGSFRGVRIAFVPSAGPLAGRPVSSFLSVRVDSTPAPCASVASAPLASPCPLCPQGSALRVLHALSNVALCQTPQPDGGASVAEAPVSGTCAEPQLGQPPLGSAPLTALSPGDQFAWGYGASNGLAILRTSTPPRAVPLLLDRAPSDLELDPGGALLAHADALTYELTDAGFELRNIEATQSCSSIRGAETFRFRANGLSVAASSASSTFTLADSEGVSAGCSSDMPVLGEALLLPDGGSGAIIAARDRVWANAPFPSSGGAPWPVRIAPAPFATIRSLTVLQPTAATGGWASSFVLANEQVFSIRADSVNRWSSAPLLGPAGEPLRLWADPHLGRLTYRDGATYSLPLFSRLVGPLPEPAPQVLDLDEACGSAYALGQTGLFRLEQPGSWQAVPLPAGPARRWTMLQSLSDAIYGFSEDGRGFVLTDSACARP